jgi:hypothetical protein
MDSATKNTVSEFQYQPLALPSTEIRLIILEPAASDSDEIRSRLQTLDIDGAHYKALSYAWVDARVKSTIFVNDKPVQVTTNL